jgi:hypothetical protein
MINNNIQKGGIDTKVFNTFKFLFKDLNSYGKPDYSLSFISEDAVYNANPEMYAFYMQFLNALNDPNPELIPTVMKIVSSTKLQEQQFNERMKEITKSLKFILESNRYKDGMIEPRLVKKINALLKSNTLTQNLTADPDYDYLIGGGRKIKIKKPKRILKLGGDNRTYYSRLGDKLEKAIQDNNEEEIEHIVSNYKENPIYGDQVEEVTPTDRAIFIALTYVIRVIALFLLDWGINCNMITVFDHAFLMYFLSYMVIFGVIVLLVNTDNNNLFFRMLLYYVDTQNNGWGRVLVHIFFQASLIPMIWILKDRTSTKVVNDYSSGREIYRIISNYTFFIWLFTSTIALRY